MQHLGMLGGGRVVPLDVNPSVGMGHDHDPAGLVDELPDEGGAVHPEDVFPEAVDQKVSLFGCDLAAREDGEPIAPGQLLDLFGLPEAVVIGYAQAVEADALGFTDEPIRGEGAVYGGGGRYGCECRLSKAGARQRGKLKPQSGTPPVQSQVEAKEERSVP